MPNNILAIGTVLQIKSKALHIDISVRANFFIYCLYTKAHYGSLLNGLLFGALLTEVLKTLVAEARPHFLDTCKPTNLNCTEKGQ